MERSVTHPEIQQQDIQQLIWGVEAYTPFQEYPSGFQDRVRPLAGGLHDVVAGIPIIGSQTLMRKSLSSSPERLRSSTEVLETHPATTRQIKRIGTMARNSRNRQTRASNVSASRAAARCERACSDAFRTARFYR